MALCWGQRPVHLAVYCSITHYLTLRHVIHSCVLYLSVRRSGIQQLPSWQFWLRVFHEAALIQRLDWGWGSAPRVTHLAVGREPPFPSQGPLCRVTGDMAAGLFQREGWKSERSHVTAGEPRVTQSQ